MRAIVLTTFFLITLLASLPEAQNTGPVAVVSSAGRRALATTTIGDQEFVALDDVSAFFPLTVRDDRQTGGVTIGYRGKTIVASPDRALVSVDGRVVALPAALTRTGGRWMAPLDFIPRALGLLSDQRLEFRRSSRLLLIGNVKVPRVSIKVEAAPTSRVTIDVSPAAPVTTDVEHDRVVLRIDGDGLDLAAPSGTAPLVTQVRAGDQPNTLVILLAQSAGDAHATTATTDTSTRITVDVPATSPASVTEAPAARPAPPSPSLPPIKTGLRTLVLDPGHGGEDSGVHGAGGLLEKQITLEVARRVKGLVEARMGIRVLLTRDDDRALGIDERTAIANNSKGDLFLSLHMNASRSTATSGAEVLFMKLDREGEETRRDAGAQALALPVLGGGTRVIETIRWDLAQARHVDDSGRLADMLAAALDGRVPVGPQPVQAAPLRVLAGLNMPAALLEMGYLTNPQQEKQAGSDDYRAPVAQAVYEAVNRFAAYIEGRTSH